MPKIVDKVLRREEILDAYIRLVQREGMAAATTRMLARECKMAVGGLWGYFDSFENLRVAAFERAFIAAGQMLMEDGLGTRGLIGLASTLKHIMPIRGESSTEAQLFTAFLESEPREQIYAVQIRMEALWRHCNVNLQGIELCNIAA